MNIFRAVTYVNITGSMLQAILILFFLFCPGLQVVGIPIVLGYMIRTIPEIIDGTPDMPPFSFMGFIGDFARGLATLIAICVYFAPLVIGIGSFVGRITSQGRMTVQERDFILISVFCLGLISFLLLAVGMIRFALTNDARAYLNLPGNIGLILTHRLGTLSFLMNITIATCLTVMFLVCGGFLFIPIWIFVLCYLMARYAADLGLASMKMKRKNDLLYAPRAEPEKQKAG